ASCCATSRGSDPPALAAVVIPRSYFSALSSSGAGIGLTLQYLLVTFPQREIFSHPFYSRRHGKPAPWRSLLRKSSAPKASASIGLALPSDKSMYGYLSEHHSFGETEEVAGEYAEELAAEMLATTLNVEFDPDLSFDEKKEVYRISNKIVRTMNVTQSAVGDKRGLWTTVLGAAILIGEDD